MLPTTQPGLEKYRHIFAPRAFGGLYPAIPRPPKLSSTPTEAQEAALEAWQLKSDKAAGYIFLAVEDNQKVRSPSEGAADSLSVLCVAYCDIRAPLMVL